MYVRKKKAAKMTFVRKTSAFNVDEIDGLSEIKKSSVSKMGVTLAFHFKSLTKTKESLSKKGKKSKSNNVQYVPQNEKQVLINRD